MRKHAVWLVTLPLTLTCIESAHAAANALFGSPTAELFETPTTGRSVLPIVAALTLGAIVAGVAARIVGASWTPRTSRTLALPFVLIPPVGFVVLEVTEAFAGGGIDRTTLLGRTFLAGLALQLPFALVGYVVARLLLKLSDDVGELVGRIAIRRLSTAEPVPVAWSVESLRPALLHAGTSARGPPSPPSALS